MWFVLVFTVILFLLDLSSLNKDVFLSLFFNAYHSFVTTVNILLQICDDCVTAARQQNWAYHFLKNLHLLKRETYLQ